MAHHEHGTFSNTDMLPKRYVATTEYLSGQLDATMTRWSIQPTLPSPDVAMPPNISQHPKAPIFPTSLPFYSRWSLWQEKMVVRELFSVSAALLSDRNTVRHVLLDALPSAESLALESGLLNCPTTSCSLKWKTKKIYILPFPLGLLVSALNKCKVEVENESTCLCASSL